MTGFRTDRWRKMVGGRPAPRLHQTLPGLAELVRDLRHALKQEPHVGLCIVDVDGMASFNAAHGYASGDSALEEIGRYLQGVSLQANGQPRPVYRFRGDEFALLVVGEGEHSALRAVQCIHADTHDRRALTSGLTLSAGCAVAPRDGRTAAALVLTADARMTFAKIEGVHASDPGVYLRSWVDLVRRRADLLEGMTEKRLNRIEATDAESDYLAQLAFTDALTGLPNHRALRAVLDDWISADQPLSVLFVDGDGLKAYNAQLGYDAGDQMIRSLAAVIAGAVPASAVVGRWLSGDEFLVVMEGADDLHIAHQVLDTVRRASAAWPLPVTVSIGVARYPGHAWRVDPLIKCAAAANDRAKRSGKDCVVVYAGDGGNFGA